MNLRFAIIFLYKLLASHQKFIIFINCVFPLLCLFFIFTATLLVDSPIPRFSTSHFRTVSNTSRKCKLHWSSFKSMLSKKKKNYHPSQIDAEKSTNTFFNYISKWNLHMNYVILYFCAWNMDIFIASENLLMSHRLWHLMRNGRNVQYWDHLSWSSMNFKGFFSLLTFWNLKWNLLTNQESNSNQQ